MKRTVLVALTLATTSAVLATTPVSAATRTSSSLASLKRDVLSIAAVSPFGFTTVLEKVRTSSLTSARNCHGAAEQVFADKTSETGLASEVLECANTSAASALLKQIRSQSSATSAVPPKRLGRSAIERNIGRSTYAIYWQRGRLLEVVALTTNLVAATSSTTSTSTVPESLTPALASALSSAALKQNELIG